MELDCLNYTCQGESHKATNKVCQDYSYSRIYENEIAVAMVSDGHGGKRYFRSDVGSRLACEVAEKNVTFFLEAVGDNLFQDKPYTATRAIATQISNSQFEKENKIDKAFRQLFSSIIFEWNKRVLEHAKTTPLTADELAQIDEKWRREFEEGISLEKVYGCTLMVYVQTKTFWFAFQIGDGKCLSFDTDAQWSEPIPWDERCFLNKTTSICDSSAIDEFRYCYQGDGTFPVAVFLGSDGIDDSFGEELNLANFYIQISKELAREHKEHVFDDIKATLPQLSKIGSKDDMSLAIIYNKEKLFKLLSKFISFEIDSIKDKIEMANNEILKRKNRISQLRRFEDMSEKNQIEYNYAYSDLNKLFTEKTELIKRINKLQKELHGEDFTQYSDNVGLELEEQKNSLPQSQSNNIHCIIQ